MSLRPLTLAAFALVACASQGSDPAANPGVRATAEMSSVRPVEAPLGAALGAGPSERPSALEVAPAEASLAPESVGAAESVSAAAEPAAAADEPSGACASGACPPPLPVAASAWEYYVERYDADGDGEVARAEYSRSDDGFRRLDANADGALTSDDFARRFDALARVPKGEKFTYGRGGPRVGDEAPAFALRTTTGEEVELARFRGEKPVVLVFGSFT